MYKMSLFCIKLFKKKNNNETTLFYNSLNLTLYSLLPSHFMPLCYHASLLNHIAHQHRYYLSLSKNFLKLKLDYKSYIYMLNIIHTHTHTHTHTYIYIYGGRFGYSSECKIYNRSPHRLLSVLGNRLRPPCHTPLVELYSVRFGSVQVGFVGCRRNLNRPSNKFVLQNFSLK